MEIYQALIEDHRNLIHILERLEGTTEDSSKLRRDLLEDLYVELTSHAAAEEDIFLSLMKEVEETQGPALDASNDLSDAIMLLEQLTSNGPRDDHWPRGFAKLKETIEEHIRNDEERLVPRAKQIVEPEAAERMGESFDDIKDGIVQRSHMH